MVTVVAERASSLPLTKREPLFSIPLLTAKFHTFAVCDPREAYILLWEKLWRKHKGPFFGC